MTRSTVVMDFLAMRSARRQPRRRGSWLYGAIPFALIVATAFLMRASDAPYGWQIVTIVLVGVVLCPALVLLAATVSDRRHE